MWGSFTFALLTSIYCLAALVRRDWIERQRLTFPIVELPLAITGEDAQPTLRTSLLNNRLFWLGFTIPAVYLLTDRLNVIFPAIPSLKLQDIEIGRTFLAMGMPWKVWGDMTISIIFPVIGISYLVPKEVSFSLWIFYLIFRLHMLAWAIAGVDPSAGNAMVDPATFHSFLEVGGVLAFCGVIIYRSRGALILAARSLFGRGPAEDDPVAPITQKWALLGFLLANAFLYGWVVRMGMVGWNFLLLIGLAYAAMLCGGYLVASGGVMFPPPTPPARSWCACSEAPPFRRPPSASCTRWTASISWKASPARSRKCCTWASSFISVAFAGVASPGWPPSASPSPSSSGSSPCSPRFSRAAPAVSACGPGSGRTGTWAGRCPGTCATRCCRTSGCAARWGSERPSCWGLVWLQSRFLWWPLSPFGFFIGSSYIMNHVMWVSIFLGWLAASLTLRYGGLRLFRELRPIALGLVLGYYIMKLPVTVLCAILHIQGTGGSFAY